MVIYGWTGVFWDMDDFPLPPGLDVDQFVKKVELALSCHGILGEVEFSAYGSSDSFAYNRYLESESFDAFKIVDKPSRFYYLLHGMLHWAHKRNRYGGEKSLFVIAKGIPGEDNDTLASFLDDIINRDHNVFTVVPDGCSPENCAYPEPHLAWYWSELCCGNTAMDLYSSDSGSSSPETDRALQGVKRASETDATGSATKRRQKDADSQK